MNGTPSATGAARRGTLDRLLGVFSDVRPGEGGRALLMLVNIFLILVAYYVIKTVREPLILNAEIPQFLQRVGIHDTAEVKTYAAAAQAFILMFFVQAYSWFASRVDRMRLIVGVTLFFAANIVAFALWVAAGVPFVGIAFYVWVGFFSLSIIAQFWSYANDIYTKEAGNRLFPVIGIGMTAGTPVGAWIAEQLFHAHVHVQLMLYLAAGLLLLSLGAYFLVNRSAARATSEAPAARPDVEGDRAPAPSAASGRPSIREAVSVARVLSRSSGEARPAAPSPPAAQAALSRGSGFSLVFANPYILLIAVLLVVLNVVNTTGEYILSHLVVEHAEALAAADAAFDRNEYVGAFYGNYFFWVNVASVALQAFVASRLVKYFGLAGVLFALPLIALGAYGFVAIGATLSVVRWAKTAENSTDYSVMNTARQLLWLPTSREEKYKAKQAVDSFFVRLGDMAAALVVFAGTTWVSLDANGFAAVNLCLIAVWLALAAVLVRRNRRLSAEAAAG